MHVELYSDGSSRGNPGKGGYGAILKYGKHEKEFSQGYHLTTNNRMELMAAIVGLEALKQHPLEVTIYSDSRYVIDPFEKGWIFNWEKKGFEKKKNPDLWKRFLRIYRKHHVKFVWVRGHNGHQYNERCDYLATTAADTGPWLNDDGFNPHEELFS
ncbi:MAG: ribonuclease HI [Chitinophagales bacterium]